MNKEERDNRIEQIQKEINILQVEMDQLKKDKYIENKKNPLRDFSYQLKILLNKKDISFQDMCTDICFLGQYSRNKFYDANDFEYRLKEANDYISKNFESYNVNLSIDKINLLKVIYEHFLHDGYEYADFDDFEDKWKLVNL